MRTVNLITLLLVLIGGLNWGLVGLANYNLVAGLLGEASMLTRMVYILVGVSALWQLVPFVKAMGEGEVAAERAGA